MPLPETLAVVVPPTVLVLVLVLEPIGVVLTEIVLVGSEAETVVVEVTEAGGQ